MDFGRDESDLSFKRRLKNRVKQIAYKHAVSGCKMIGVSEAVYEDLCQIRGSKAENYLVRNAISTERLDVPSVNALSLDPAHDVVIFGTHFERKGVDIALRAVMKAGNGLHLVVLTHRESDAVEKLNALSADWQSYARVCHVVEDITDVYNYALCFISPSRSEAFGYAVVEAAYCNTQVIASDIPGQNSMKCVPGIQWVKPEDADDLARALSNCYQIHQNLPMELQKQKTVQREYIRDNFGVDRWCTEILKVYGLLK
ncbi:glycosyltransferase family 4 protein [Stecheria sp. CLA-KB-P133]|uniref:Glycosyltransferase family 4 protein n=1 Tax=Grylomicrobium aquisgranensis TaxID=2926318 RepID=A0AB35U5Q5_9FIRM|nr:glycosyltransferase family 4 protein [Stecheria sp. CLA-KB-P133]